jgi:hypothetical protein
VASSVVKLRIVAGDGNEYELAPNTGDPNDEDVNPFYAAGVAMGLFGILSAVTFRCIPSYKVKGDVVTCSVRDPGAPADPYAAGPRGLEQWFEAQEYNRTLIWPQKGIEKIEFWRAERIATGPGFRPKPYVQLAETLQKVASVIYRTVDKKPPPYDDATYETMRAAINTFVTDGSEQFWDHWYRGLPIDNTISDLWMPTEFTDLFVDIRHTTKLMRTLRDFWKGDRRMERTGPYTAEVYATKESRFWMSPAFQRRSVRVDMLWFKSGKTSPADTFYPQYWELLRPLAFRFHWGKHLSPPASSTGVGYRRAVLGEERWKRWMELRQRFDPDQIFVSDYWRGHLGIERKSSPT